MKLIKMEVPNAIMRLKQNMDTQARNIEVFTTVDGIGIISSEDNTPQWGWLKHISISRQDRYPDWKEILEIKEQLFGDTDVMMILPKKEDYVNVHPNCFHLWACPERWELQ